MEHEQQPSSSRKYEDELYRQARMFWELSQDPGQAFATPETLAERVKRLEAGLPVEDEFACFAWWSDRCSLIHALDQTPLPALARDRFQVPDFILAFEHDGKTVTVLVEVKRQDLTFSQNPAKNHLRFGAAQHAKLTNYASLLRLPLLIAWKARPFGWLLFDIRAASLVRTAYRITFDDALRETLLGLIFGDFSVSFMERAAFVMKFQRLSPGEEKFEAQVADVYFENGQGERVTHIDGPFVDLFSMGSDEIESAEADGLITQRFVKK